MCTLRAGVSIAGPASYERQSVATLISGNVSGFLREATFGLNSHLFISFAQSSMHRRLVSPTSRYVLYAPPTPHSVSPTSRFVFHASPTPYIPQCSIKYMRIMRCITRKALMSEREGILFSNSEIIHENIDGNHSYDLSKRPTVRMKFIKNMFPHAIDNMSEIHICSFSCPTVTHIEEYRFIMAYSSFIA